MTISEWNVLEEKNTSGHLHLGNTSATILQFERRIDIDLVLAGLLYRLNQAKVPFSYTEYLREIYFTFLPNKRGDYEPGYIRLSSCMDDLNVLATTMVHELGHHIDELEGIYKRPKLIEEFKNKKIKTEATNLISEDIHEYIAIGFELFYFGKHGAKQKMKQENYKLYNCIKYLHYKYTKNKLKG